MLDRNLVVVQFEGVLGYFARPHPWSRKRPHLVLRDHLARSLSQLHSSFQLVLFFLSPQQKVRAIIKSLESTGIIFDGVYRNRSEGGGHPYLQNYDQVLTDFGATPATTLVSVMQVVAPILLGETDLRERKGAQIVLERTGRRLCDIHV